MSISERREMITVLSINPYSLQSLLDETLQIIANVLR